MSRRLGRFALLALVVPLVALAAIEGLVSVGLFVHDAIMLELPANFRQATYDSLVGWVGIPNMSNPDNYGPGLALHTNADGMRIHRPVAPALAAGEQRAICSGDSFTYGSGVSDAETFCAYLEREWPGVQTLNMSQRGFGIDQAYLWYKRDGARYPHQLHVFAFIWNDFERMAQTSNFGYPKPRLRLVNGALALENVPVPPWAGASHWTQALGLLTDLRLVQAMQRRLDLSDGTKMRRIDGQVWDVAEAVFGDLARLNTSRGSRLVLVYLPAPPDLTPGVYDVRRRRLGDFSTRSGIPLVDLTPEMRSVPADSLDWMFITDNALKVNGSAGHYTAMGHDWVARKLAVHLRRLRLLEPTGAAAPTPTRKD